MAGAKAHSPVLWQERHPAFGCRTPISFPKADAPGETVPLEQRRARQTSLGRHWTPPVGRLGKVKPEANLSLTWEGATYPRVAPGVYRAVCETWQGPEYCVAFRRYSLRLQFSLLDDGTRVSLFLNLDKSGPPRRGSKFYRTWCMANGEQPRKGQKMALETFTEPGLIYTVRVEDCAKDDKGEGKPDALVYSRVTEIVKVEQP